MSLETLGAEVVGRARAMASDITIRSAVGEDEQEVRVRIDEALQVFNAVERACTRFDPCSSLMRANARLEHWNRVGRVCFDALIEAHWAYRETAGRFDPRVLSDLVAMGYSRSLPFAEGNVLLDGGPRPDRPPMPFWRPRFREVSEEVMLGSHPVDLGGIAKGLAVRWASQVLAGGHGYLVEAGGDCYCAGTAPDGGPWRIAVEDPAGGTQPLAVLAIGDLACATSSVRLRRWKVGGKSVHHIVDPDTGQSGGEGLASVTVVATDPAVSEVWSKVLFLRGSDAIGELAAQRGLAAMWVDESGAVAASPGMECHVLWRAA
ncbi:MAG TPA: FAD:protein FMN transferase [Acidimicrobiales bacterium]|nr:FAD:protein FMN transferase [Acidimicrobiales bacterium]HVA10147.1 FAD:protein FMN transferase [Acidimicrobiales bacterium]